MKGFCAHLRATLTPEQATPLASLPAVEVLSSTAGAAPTPEAGADAGQVLGNAAAGVAPVAATDIYAHNISLPLEEDMDFENT